MLSAATPRSRSGRSNNQTNGYRRRARSGRDQQRISRMSQSKNFMDRVHLLNPGEKIMVGDRMTERLLTSLAALPMAQLFAESDSAALLQAVKREGKA
jgi:hypothetical protein